MDRADPRAAYDDLYETNTVNEVAPERYDDLVYGEPFTTGWVTVASVLDERGRILLIYDADDEAWMLPGGTLQPGESLLESVVREVDEEAGVEIEPVRPHSAIEVGCTDGERSAAFTVVGFEATPQSTTSRSPTPRGSPTSRSRCSPAITPKRCSRGRDRSSCRPQ